LNAAVIPMSDDPVRTRVATDAGELSFQEWFVGKRCEPPVRGLRFEDWRLRCRRPRCRRSARRIWW